MFTLLTYRTTWWVVGYGVFSLNKLKTSNCVSCPALRKLRSLIPRLHDKAGSTSWLVQLTYIIARCLLDHVSGVLVCDCRG